MTSPATLDTLPPELVGYVAGLLLRGRWDAHCTGKGLLALDSLCKSIVVDKSFYEEFTRRLGLPVWLNAKDATGLHVSSVCEICKSAKYRTRIYWSLNLRLCQVCFSTNTITRLQMVFLGFNTDHLFLISNVDNRNFLLSDVRKKGVDFVGENKKKHLDEYCKRMEKKWKEEVVKRDKRAEIVNAKKNVAKTLRGHPQAVKAAVRSAFDAGIGRGNEATERALALPNNPCRMECSGYQDVITKHVTAANPELQAFFERHRLLHRYKVKQYYMNAADALELEHTAEDITVRALNLQTLAGGREAMMWKVWLGGDTAPEVIDYLKTGSEASYDILKKAMLLCNADVMYATLPPVVHVLS